MNAAPTGNESPDVLADWLWARGHEEECIKLVRDHVCKIGESTTQQDMRQATDYVLTTPSKISVAMRIRRISNTGKKRHLTLRLSRRSGAKTEVAKISKGHGDLYCYVWIDDTGKVNEYIFVDLKAMRDSGLLDKPDGEKSTNDGSATFAWWHWETLQDHGCIIEGCKYPGEAVSFKFVTNYKKG